MRRLLIACVLAVLPALASAAVPRPYTADYDVLRNGEPLGRATVSFTAQAGGYEMRSSTRGTEGLAAIAGVSIDEASTLRLTGGRLETVSYRFEQKLAFKSPKARQVRVDANTGRITSIDKGQSVSLPYQPGVLDRNAVTAALVQDLAAGKTGDLTYPVVDRESVSQQRYRSAATESVSTPMGRQRALRVERIRDSGDGRTTTLWLGVDRNFVPLKIVQTEANGETIEMRVTGIK